MLVKDLIDKWDMNGLRESLFLGVSEAQELGKQFIGITLSNGDGIILKVNPYEEDISSIFLMSTEKRDNLNFIALFKNKEDITYFIYEIVNYDDFFRSMFNTVSVVYVEVISGDLEDFLYRTAD